MGNRNGKDCYFFMLLVTSIDFTVIVRLVIPCGSISEYAAATRHDDCGCRHGSRANSRLHIQDLGFRIQDVGFRIQDLCLGFRVWDEGFRI